MSTNPSRAGRGRGGFGTVMFDCKGHQRSASAKSIARALRLIAFFPCILGAISCRSKESVNRIETFDAGPVLADETISYSHEFRIQNSGSQVLRILDESHSCTCTKVEIPIKELRPGGSGIVRMKVTLGTGFEMRSLICDVKTDHPEVPNRRFVLNITAYPRSQFVPSEVSFGTITSSARRDEGAVRPRPAGRNLTSRAWLEVYARTQTEPLPKLGEVVAPDELLVSLDRKPVVEYLPDGIRRCRYPVTVALRSSDLPEQSYRRHIEVPVDGGKAAALFVDWKLAGPLTFAPSVLSFGIVKSGDSTAKTIRGRMTTRSERPFRILEVETGSPWLVAANGEGDLFPTTSARLHELVFEFRAPESQHRAVSGVAVIRTDDAQSAELRIPWSAFLRSAETAVRVSGQ